MKRRVLIFLFVCTAWVTSTASAMAVVRIEPAVLDITSTPHDYQYFTIQVVNEGASRIALYPLVGEFDAQTGTVHIPGSPYESKSLISANLEINRELVEVGPHGSVSLTGKINVSPDIPEGIYHAILGLVPDFPKGGTTGLRPDPAMPRALLNVTVQKEKHQRLNLIGFNALRRIFLQYPARFMVRLNNGGNQAVSPDIRTQILDRGNTQKGLVKSDAAGGSIAPGDTIDVPVAWNGSGFGRFQALISVNYGTKDGAQVLTANVTFWVLPWWLLLALAVLLIILSYGAARVIWKGMHRHHDVA